MNEWFYYVLIDSSQAFLHFSLRANHMSMQNKEHTGTVLYVFLIWRWFMLFEMYYNMLYIWFLQLMPATSYDHITTEWYYLALTDSSHAVLHFNQNYDCSTT